MRRGLGELVTTHGGGVPRDGRGIGGVAGSWHAESRTGRTVSAPKGRPRTAWGVSPRKWASHHAFRSPEGAASVGATRRCRPFGARALLPAGRSSWG